MARTPRRTFRVCGAATTNALHEPAAWGPMDDVLVIGGGAVGLSAAYELSGHGLKVHLVDRTAPGEEASWAGAGILPPAKFETAADPYEQLAGLSNALHQRWAAQLREQTGIDNGYRRCGAVCLALDAGEAAELQTAAAHWQSRQIECQKWSAEALAEGEPGIEVAAPAWHAAWHLPDEAQIRNPRHLKALLSVCRQRGVRITAGAAAEDFLHHGDRVEGVRTNLGDFRAGAVLLAAGCWSGTLAARLGLTLPVRPIRGQIVLLRGDCPVIQRVVHVGSCYLVPRDDGRVLVGSTEEDVGFDKRTTAEAVRHLLGLALDLVPRLAEARIERCWAGLRPGPPHGWPVIGPAPGWRGLYVAAGHYRAGLQLSPGTAVVLSAAIRGDTSPVDLSAFAFPDAGQPTEKVGQVHRT